MSNIDILRQGIEYFGIEASDKMLADFQKYKEILVEWNQKMNLTGIEDEKEVFIKHFLDSLNKRINFLQEVANQIDIDDIEFIHGRAEDFGKDENYRECFDIATARAVAGLPALMEFCVPFVKVGGHFVCLKGPNANLELEESKKAMEVLGIEYIEKIDIKLPEIDLDHNILVFKKVKNTPSKYPRKAGKVTKNPIK